jgi:cation:H+ antiporter
VSQLLIYIVYAVLGLIGGIALLAYSSDKAVEHSISIASRLGVSPLMIGLVIVSLGTDLPEISNSIISSSIGHADINVGDSFGSVLIQITLVLGLVAILGVTFKVKRDEVIVIGACEILALIAAVSIVEKGYISRMNAFFLVASWPLLMLIIKNIIKKDYSIQNTDRRLHRHVAIAVIGYIGIALGAYVVVNSVVALSSLLYIDEYIISFFIVAIGTSLPELAVDLTAIRKKQYEIAIGDAIGSCLVDASVSVGIGPLVSPISPVMVSGGLAETTGLYALFASVIVLSALALRQRLDSKIGVLFLIIYGLSYVVFYIW